MRRGKIRIVTDSVSGVPAKGQDTFVYFIDEDGVRHLVPNVLAAKWCVDSRAGYCMAELTVFCEIDAEAQIEKLVKSQEWGDGVLGTNLRGEPPGEK